MIGKIGEIILGNSNFFEYLLLLQDPTLSKVSSSPTSEVRTTQRRYYLVYKQQSRLTFTNPCIVIQLWKWPTRCNYIG